MSQIEKNVDLTPFNTLRVPARAKDFIILKETGDVKGLHQRRPILLLGSGANILFTKDFPGLVIKNEIKGRKILDENETQLTIELGSGESWIELVNWAVRNGLSGIENLALIPGTVGAAAAGNIAAYGQNFEDVCVSVSGSYLPASQDQVLRRNDCQFTYRGSIFTRELSGKFLVTSVTIRLSKKPIFDTNYHSRYESLHTSLLRKGPAPYKPGQIADAVSRLRLEKLPDWRKIGTAGSFFKNPLVPWSKYQELAKLVTDLQWYPPEKLLYTSNSSKSPNNPNRLVRIPAGRFLDELGWKGKRIGNVGTWPKHALTVVNYGGVTGKEILEFANKMKADIKSHFDIDLEPEVQIL